MKMILYSLCIIIFAAIFATLSCSKTSNSSTAGTRPSLNTLFAALRYTPQAINLTAGRDTIVFGNKGTMLHFYTNSFQTANGNTISGGTITLQLIEMYKTGDMICNRATTMSGKKLLQSGGEINVSATMNGQTVYAKQYGLGFLQPNATFQPMSLFFGNTDNGDSVVNWSISDTARVFPIDTNTAIPTISNAYGRPWVGFVFDSANGLQYTNCDAFYNSDSPLVSVSVTFPDTSFNFNNTEIYLVLPAINCAMSTIEPLLGSSYYNAFTMTIESESQTNIVPAGMAYKLVVITNKNGQYYYWQTAGTIPHNGLNLTATMTQQAQTYITAQMQAL